jgi:hypothetical protein
MSTLINVANRKNTSVIILAGLDLVEATKWKTTATRASEMELVDNKTREGKPPWSEATHGIC